MDEVLQDYPVRPTVSLNLALLDHFPDIATLIRQRQWGVMSHGIYNTRFLYGMDEAQERAFYRDNIDSLKRHTGQDLKGILTPAITNTERTPALIAESGMLYHADWVHDDVPVPIIVPGRKLVSMPYSYDLNDAPLWDGRPYGGRYFVDACKAAFDRLYAESDEGGRVFALHCTPTKSVSHTMLATCGKSSTISVATMVSGTPQATTLQNTTWLITTTNSWPMQRSCMKPVSRGRPPGPPWCLEQCCKHLSRPALGQPRGRPATITRTPHGTPGPPAPA